MLLRPPDEAGRSQALPRTGAAATVTTGFNALTGSSGGGSSSSSSSSSSAVYGHAGLLGPQSGMVSGQPASSVSRCINGFNVVERQPGGPGMPGPALLQMEGPPQPHAQQRYSLNAPGGPNPSTSATASTLCRAPTASHATASNATASLTPAVAMAVDPVVGAGGGESRGGCWGGEEGLGGVGGPAAGTCGGASSSCCSGGSSMKSLSAGAEDGGAEGPRAQVRIQHSALLNYCERGRLW